MKIFHLSDLHIGKLLHSYNLGDLQSRMLAEIVRKAKEYQPDVILIAGDLYDKSVPSGEAYVIFDEFLTQLSQLDPVIPVLMIAGNHDNPLRLQYARSFLEKHQLYLSVLPPQSEQEHIKKVVLKDSHGPVNFYLLPFTRPSMVRSLFPEGEVTDYDSAVRLLLEREQVDLSQRNVLVSHQFYVSLGQQPDRCDSELASLSIGGLDSVDVSCLSSFDYVALGHIHGAQQIGHPWIRYSGTPLKYSVSEEHHKKGITFVTLGEKGQEPVVEQIPLPMSPDVRSLRGTLQEVLDQAEDGTREDYVSITLTDEDSLYHPKDQLEEQYPHILEVRLDNTRTRKRMELVEEQEETLDPLELFAQFYQEMNDQPMSEREREIMEQVIQKAGEE